MNEVSKTEEGQHGLVVNVVGGSEGKRMKVIRLGSEKGVSVRRIEKEGLDRATVENLAIRGEIEIVCQTCDVLFRLRHDGTNWIAEERGRHGAAELIDRSTLRFSSANLPSLANGMKKVQTELEAAASVDAGLQVRFALDLDATTAPSRMRDCLRYLWEFSGNSLFLLTAEETPRSRLLNSREALRYLREKHGLALSREALYMAIRRGRLAAYVGEFRNGRLRPMMRRHRSSTTRQVTSGRKIRGAWVFTEEDLKEYACRRGWPDKSVQAVIASASDGEKSRIRGPYGEALPWFSCGGAE
jgi:hypothetical protein